MRRSGPSLDATPLDEKRFDVRRVGVVTYSMDAAAERLPSARPLTIGRGGSSGPEASRLSQMHVPLRFRAPVRGPARTQPHWLTKTPRSWSGRDKVLHERDREHWTQPNLHARHHAATYRDTWRAPEALKSKEIAPIFKKTPQITPKHGGGAVAWASDRHLSTGKTLFDRKVDHCPVRQLQ